MFDQLPHAGQGPAITPKPRRRAGLVALKGEAGQMVLHVQDKGRAEKDELIVIDNPATRSMFDTVTVTPPELAERVKALIDDLREDELIR